MYVCSSFSKGTQRLGINSSRNLISLHRCLLLFGIICGSAESVVLVLVAAAAASIIIVAVCNVTPKTLYSIITYDGGTPPAGLSDTHQNVRAESWPADTVVMREVHGPVDNLQRTAIYVRLPLFRSERRTREVFNLEAFKCVSAYDSVCCFDKRKV